MKTVRKSSAARSCRLGLACLVSFPSLVAVAAPDVAHLRCEYRDTPLGIDTPQPRLSWAIESDQRGERQTAYQILVASSPALLAKDAGDLWDSGKVTTDQSIQVAYAGKPLLSRQACVWKVTVWPAAGAAITSKPAAWSMGLLSPEDWQAKWIGSPTAAAVEPAPMLRKTFALEKTIQRATAYVSGLGYYELSVNGKKVGDHELDPKFTRYDRRVLYVTYDVTAQLKPGRNALGVMLGNGWYNYHVKNAWDFDTAPWRGRPKLLLRVDIDFADGTKQVVVSDDSWKHATGPIQFDGLLSGEVYDARLEKAGWDSAGFDDSTWAAAKVVEAPKGKLTAQMVQPIRITEVLRPVKVSQPKPGVFVYDMGQNIAGKARLTVSGPAGTEVKLQYAEMLRPDGTINPDNIKAFCKSAEFQTERYLLKGAGTEIWQSRFMYHGFQYVQVTGFPGEPKLENLQALVMHTDVESVGAFECSNALLNKIQQCTRWSYLNNLHGHPTDCPQREKNGWTGDAHLAAETGLYNFDAAAAYTQWMKDFKDEQRDSGELPGIVPTGGWGYAWGSGPSWDSAYVLIPWYLYQYCGDARILADHYDNLKRYVDYLGRKTRNGIVGIGLGDWCPAKTTTPEKVTSTGYYYCDAVIVSKIAAILGKTEDAQTYAKLADDIKQVFNREFVNPQTKQVAGGTQTALSCALYQGLALPAEVDAIVSNLVANVERQGNHLDCGILGTKYLLHALSDNGRADVAYKITTQTTAPGWGAWINQGATTLWEEWGGGGSHNHVMFGDVSAWMFETLAGIRPDPAAAGFKKIIIKPEIVGDLTWVKGSYNSGYGRIASAWKIDGNKLTLSVTIPPNTTATVHVPAKDVSSVREDGLADTKPGGVASSAKMQGNCAVMEIGAGTYVFTSQLK
jgi:alpha-L-rhamnosidase